ncbi:MAG TPA: carboxypeptidase regulatory-like domain-containing protein [Terracidiphilus sp.]|nr:carboxypeptidase regulatory-like domain-containing protein [Terracidiphilus sp.]
MKAQIEVLTVIVAALIAASSLQAQVTGATIVGNVKDSTGAPVGNAQVEVIRPSTSTHVDVKTNDSGSYTVPNLTPGTYKISVSAATFSTVVTDGVTLEVGQNVVENFTLTPGTVVQQVEVTEAVPVVDLASSQISDVVDETTVRQLPLNTRDWTLLATLQPGVSQVRTEKAVAVGADRGNRGFGAQLTVAGGRPQQNNYRMDGISINDYSNGAPGSVSGIDLGVDAIQEFSVVTANASAEYGREAGGVINAVSRGGTNDFHGTAFNFFRNDKLDARNYFDPAKKGELRKNQFGGALGGRIIKDKTFFFADYEGIREVAGIPFNVNAPSANARKGILNCSQLVGSVQQAGCPTPGPAAAGSTYTVPVSADVASYLKFYGTPTTQPANSDSGSYTFTGKQITPETFGQGRIDEIFSAKDSAHSTYMYDDGNFTQPDAENNYYLLSHTNRQLGLLEETHIFSSSIINTARGGISRNVANITNTAPGLNSLASDTTLGGVPGRTASSLVIGGLTNFGGGLAAPSQYNFYWTSIQAYDDAFYTLGNHTFRFGGGFERMRNNIVATSSPAGLYTFGSTADFIAGRVQNFSAQLPDSIPEKGLRQTLGAGYALDDWKALHNLTLNLGVRYEATTVPTEVHGYLSRLVNLTDTAPTLGGTYFSNPTLKNFEPRVGIVWSPFKNQKTAIRGGFGIFDILPLPYQFELLSSLAAPYLKVGSVVYSNAAVPYTTIDPGDGKFAHGSYSSIQAPSALRQSYIQPHPGRNYLMEWNLNIEQDLGHSLSMYLGFVGSKGVHQPFRTDEANTVQPIGLTNGQLTFPKPGTTPVLNPSVGQIAAIFYNNNTYYDGLEVGFTKTMGHGLQAQASYTYSKAIDLGSAVLAGDPFGNSISGLFYFAPKTRRGVADFNIPNEFTFNFLYQTPIIKRLHGPLDLVANGWETSGIFFMQNGLPFTPTIAGDSLGLKGTAPYNVPNRIKNTPGCGTGVNSRRAIGYINLSCFTFPSPNANGTTVYGNAGRNSLLGPSLNSLDFSAMKTTHISRDSDKYNLQFRAEFYNILNHSNFSPPIANRTVFTASGATVGTAGNITSTVTTSRQIQFGLKLLF